MSPRNLLYFRVGRFKRCMRIHALHFVEVRFMVGLGLGLGCMMHAVNLSECVSVYTTYIAAEFSARRVTVWVVVSDRVRVMVRAALVKNRTSHGFDQMRICQSRSAFGQMRRLTKCALQYY